MRFLIESNKKRDVQLRFNYHKYLSPSNTKLLTAAHQEGFAFEFPRKIYLVVGGGAGIVIRGSNLWQVEVGTAGPLRAENSSSLGGGQ